MLRTVEIRLGEEGPLNCREDEGWSGGDEVEAGTDVVLEPRDFSNGFARREGVANFAAVL
jgi:hypothetical protein